MRRREVTAKIRYDDPRTLAEIRARLQWDVVGDAKIAVGRSSLVVLRTRGLTMEEADRALRILEVR